MVHLVQLRVSKQGLPSCCAPPHPVTLNITDITPLPVNISRWDEPLPYNLFRPMVRLQGSVDGMHFREGCSTCRVASATWIASEG